MRMEEWIEILMLNMGCEEEKEVAEKLESHPARRWGWEWVEVLDIYLGGIEEWDEMEVEERKTLAEKIIKYLMSLS